MFENISFTCRLSALLASLANLSCPAFKPGDLKSLQGALGLPKSIKLIHAASALWAGVVLLSMRGETAVKSWVVEVLRKGEQMCLIIPPQQSEVMRCRTNDGLL